MDDDSYEVSDEEWAEEVYCRLDDERSNLNKEVDGIIVVFGNLGLWNGRRRGYQILGSTIADILKSQCDDAEWYGDGYNIRGRMDHQAVHDISLLYYLCESVNFLPSLFYLIWFRILGSFILSSSAKKMIFVSISAVFGSSLEWILVKLQNL